MFGPSSVPSFLTPYPGAKLIFITGALIMVSGTILDRTHLVEGGMTVCVRVTLLVPRTLTLIAPVLCLYNRIMEPRITYQRIAPPADEEGAPPSYCSATYFNPEGPVIETEEGTTEGEAVEVLYQKLKRMGYDRSKLPNPEPR